MTNGVLIGKDVTVYTVQGGGLDGPDSGFNGGVNYNFLGRWQTVELEFMNTPFEVTSSDAYQKERRFGPFDWKATLSNVVRYVGSAAMGVAMNNQYVQIQFRDGSGANYTLIGGIVSAGYTIGDEKSTEKLEIINMGFPDSFIVD